MKTRKLGVCVVGLGVGFNHARAYNKMADTVDTYICDADPARLARAREFLKGIAGGFDSVDRALASEKVEVVDISLPSYLHSKTAIKASRLGKHCLVEKPMATSLAEANQMIEEARKANVILSVGENFQFLPTTLKAIELMKSGLIGKGFLATVYHEMWPATYPRSSWWFRKEYAGGGVLLSAGVHAIRTLRMLAGSPATKVHAFGGNIATGIDSEDTCVLSMRFENGLLGSVIASWWTPRQPVMFSIHGTEGSIECRRGFDDLIVMDKGRNAANQKKIWVPTIDTIEEECRAFIKSVATGEIDRRISAEEGRKDIEVVEAAYKSMNKGKVVSLPMR